LGSPIAQIEYVLNDTQASCVVTSSEYVNLLTPICIKKNITLVRADNDHATADTILLPALTPSRRAMILYTSGTTNLPKGVVTTHENLEAQITTLIEAWQWRETDHTLCVLPLHHVHGIVNVVCCSLWIGACCEFISSFSEKDVFNIFERRQVNVFMAVPTIYFKLITYWESQPTEKQYAISDSFSSFRLMVCGSAALPVTVLKKWKAISHHTLLERYGMTEIGMAISNPYAGIRKPGFVGFPLPGVSIRLANEKDEPVIHEPGEIQVKGKNVFGEYWQKPEATANSFTQDGWFRTGDVGEQDEQGYYKILGRSSQDIIKSGGYKISAIEIEEVLRTHPSIHDCSVIGIDDEEWGEQVAAAIVVKESIDFHSMDNWLRERLSKYKVPRKFKIVAELPRNAMGKVVKKELKKLFEL
jgi:malonyl-CoA/methylmalonyl-CoA synthetase